MQILSNFHLHVDCVIFGRDQPLSYPDSIPQSFQQHLANMVAWHIYNVQVFVFSGTIFLKNDLKFVSAV